MSVAIGPIWLVPLVLALACPVASAVGSAPSLEPLTVQLELPRGPVFVGEAIQGRLFVRDGDEPPVITPPQAPDVQIILGARTFQRLPSTDDAGRIREGNAFVLEFVLVPARAGRLIVPPFRTSLGNRTGASRSVTLEVRAPPATGRPPGFLGGIGSLGIQARLEPDSVRLGETAFLQILLEGPGAYGSSAPPSVRPIPGLEIRLTGHDWNPRNARRAWLYEIKPTQAGQFRLPPALIAFYEPRPGRYQTSSTPSQRLTVASPPVFQTRDLQSSPLPSPLRPGNLAAAALGLLCGGLGAPLLWSLAGSRSRSRAYARRLARELHRVDSDQLAALVGKGLLGYLQRATSWPGGEVTPSEAHAAMVRDLGSPLLADSAAALVESLCRVRFAGESPDSVLLRDRALRFFSEASRVRPLSPRAGASTTPVGTIFTTGIPRP